MSNIYGPAISSELPKEFDLNELMNLMGINQKKPLPGSPVGFGASPPPMPGSSRIKGNQLADPIQQPMRQQHGLQQVGQSMQQQPVQKPPNVVINDMSPYERETINFKRDELRSKERMAGRKLGVTDENTDQKTAIAAQRANIYDFKAKNPGMKFMISKGGNIVAMDPITGQPHDTGVSSGTLSEREKVEIQNTGDLAEIEARGNIQKDIQGTRGTQALEQIGARTAGQRDIQGLRGDQSMEQILTRGSQQTDLQNTRGEQSLAQIAARANEQRATNAAKPSTGMQPTQAKVLEANKARQLMNTNPELAPFLKDNGDGTYSVTPPGDGGWSDKFGGAKPTQDQFKQINSILYPSSGTAAPVKAGSVPDKDAPKAPAGWKYVRKPGGGWTAVEDK